MGFTPNEEQVEVYQTICDIVCDLTDDGYDVKVVDYDVKGSREHSWKSSMYGDVFNIIDVVVDRKGSELESGKEINIVFERIASFIRSTKTFQCENMVNYGNDRQIILRSFRTKVVKQRQYISTYDTFNGLPPEK